MEKIFYFELDEEAIFRYSEEEILEAYFKKIPFEAVGDVPVVSAYAIKRDFPRELCSTNRVLLGDVHWNNYWIEEGYAECSVNELLKNSLSDADVFYELYEEEEMMVRIGLKYY